MPDMLMTTMGIDNSTAPIVLRFSCCKRWVCASFTSALNFFSVFIRLHNRPCKLTVFLQFPAVKSQCFLYIISLLSAHRKQIGKTGCIKDILHLFGRL